MKCPNCGSKNLTSRYHGDTNETEYQCRDCRHQWRKPAASSR